MNSVNIIGLPTLSKVQYVDTINLSNLQNLDLDRHIVVNPDRIPHTRIFRILPFNSTAGHFNQQLPRTAFTFQHDFKYDVEIHTYSSVQIYTLPPHRSFVIHGRDPFSSDAYCHKFYEKDINPRHLLSDKPLIFHLTHVEIQDIHQLILENHTSKQIVAKLVRLHKVDKLYCQTSW